MLLGIHLLRSVILPLLCPRTLGRQFVRVIVRPLRRLVGLECQLRWFTVEPLLRLAVRERALLGVPAGYQFCNVIPDVIPDGGKLPC